MVETIVLWQGDQICAKQAFLPGAVDLNLPEAVDPDLPEWWFRFRIIIEISDLGLHLKKNTKKKSTVFICEFGSKICLVLGSGYNN